MATKQKLYLGGLLMAFMIVHASKKRGRERERKRDQNMCLLVPYKRLNTIENYKTVSSKSAWSCSFMSGSNLQGFDWENFGAVDRWSFMGGGRL